MKNYLSLFCFLCLALLYACTPDDGSEGHSVTVEQGTALVARNCNGWDEIRGSADGSTIFNKYRADGSSVESAYFLLHNDSVPVMGYARFDENQMPRFIHFNGVSILIDNYDGSRFDASVIVNDSIILRADSLQLTFDPSRPDTRSFAQNNWVRNLCDVGNIICGAISVGVGSAMILVGAVTEGASGGTTTVISVGTIIAGTTSVIGGIRSISDALNDLFVEKYNDSEVEVSVEDYTHSSVENVFSELLGKLADDDHLAKYLPAETNNLISNNTFNLATLLSSLSFSAIDALWGETLTVEGALRDRYLNCTVLTAKATHITEHTARLNGYVDGASAQGYRTRYGFIVRSHDETETVPTPAIDNGIGESYFVDCTKLKEASSYKYLAYFWDYSNGYIKFGAARSFRTDGVPAVLDNVSLDVSTINDNNTYTYRLTADVELKDDEGIQDWGFYYIEGNAHKAYSLKDRGAGSHSYNFTYTASSPSVTLDMGTYVKYSEAPGDTLRYSGTQSYTFRHDNTYGVTIQALRLNPTSFKNGACIFGFDVTVGSKLQSMDNVLSYGYYIARRPYSSSLKFYNYYKTSEDSAPEVTKHNSIKVLRYQFDKVDEENFIATCNKYSVGTYIRFKDSTYLRLEERELQLVYDTKPGVRFISAQVGETTSQPDSEYGMKYKTEFSLSFETRGAFWIDNATWDIWSPSGTWRWEDLGSTSQPFPIFTSDGCDTVSTRMNYYETSTLDVYHYFTFELADGSTICSDNSVHYTGSTLLDHAEVTETSFDHYSAATRAALAAPRPSTVRRTALPAAVCLPPEGRGGRP